MRKHLLVLSFWVVGAVSVIVAPVLEFGELTRAAEGEPMSRVQSKQVITDIPSLDEVKQPLTTTEGLLVQQPAPTLALAQVKGVQLKPTDKGLEVILETATEFPEVLTSTANNSLITDIPNAQLRLPKGGAFRQDNPTQDIATVEVTNLDAKTLRVTVTGKAGVPTAEVSQSPQALILSVTAPLTPAAPPTTPEPTPTPPPAEPQQPAPEAPVPEPQAEEEPLDLTVTAEEEAGGYSVPNASSATLTDTPILDIPASIQVVPKQVLKDQQVIRIEEALRNVSGVSFTSSGEGRDLEPSIRGFDNAPILRDGFRIFNSAIREPVITENLERIEVLKGPASILYGEIEPGGVVNLVTEKPLSEPFYSAEFQLGNRGLIRPSIDISGPLTSDGNLLYRLNVLYQGGGDFRDFDTDTEQFFISPVVTWKIGDRTDLTFYLEYLDQERPGDFGLLAFGDGVIDVPFDRITGEPDDFANEGFLSIGYGLEHRFSENWTLRNAFRFVNQDYSSNLAFASSFDEATGIVTRNWAGQDQNFKAYSLQTNLVGEVATGPVQHKLLFGVDLNRTNEDFINYFDFFTGLPLDIFDPVYGGFSRPELDDLPVFFDTVTEVDRLGVYLQDQVSLLDNLILVAGFRYDTVEQRRTNNPNAFDPVGSEETQNDDALTPRFGIVYQPIESISLYGSYSRSFAPNTGVAADGNFLEAEQGEGFEVGVKSELLGDRLFATLAYFDITKQNVATPDPDPDNPFALVATGEQRSRGVELDINGEILPGWNVIASYAYIDADVTEDNNPDLVGNGLAGVPRNAASLWTTYTLQSGSLQGLGFGIGFNVVGESEGDLDNSFELNSYFLTNAAIFYRRNNYRFALNFKNIFNVDYIEGGAVNRFRGLDPGEPFTVIGSVSVEF